MKVINDMKWVHGPKFLRFPPALWPQDPEHTDLESEYLQHYKGEFRNEVQVLLAVARTRKEPILKFSTLLRASVFAIRWKNKVKSALLVEEPKSGEKELESTKEALSAINKWRKEFTKKSLTNIKRGKGVNIPPDLPLALHLPVPPMASVERVDILLQLFRAAQTAFENNESPKLTRFIKNNKSFLDSEGILRLGGRLSPTHLPWEEKYPIILPVKADVTRSIMINIHENILRHAFSATRINAEFNRKYWSKGSYSLAKLIVDSCLWCRVTQVIPFTQEILDVHDSQNPNRPSRRIQRSRQHRCSRPSHNRHQQEKDEVLCSDCSVQFLKSHPH